MGHDVPTDLEKRLEELRMKGPTRPLPPPKSRGRSRGASVSRKTARRKQSAAEVVEEPVSPIHEFLPMSVVLHGQTNTRMQASIAKLMDLDGVSDDESLQHAVLVDQKRKRKMRGKAVTRSQQNVRAHKVPVQVSIHPNSESKSDSDPESSISLDSSIFDSSSYSDITYYGSTLTDGNTVLGVKADYGFFDLRDDTATAEAETHSSDTDEELQFEYDIFKEHQRNSIVTRIKNRKSQLSGAAVKETDFTGLRAVLEAKEKEDSTRKESIKEALHRTLKRAATISNKTTRSKYLVSCVSLVEVDPGYLLEQESFDDASVKVSRYLSGASLPLQEAVTYPPKSESTAEARIAFAYPEGTRITTSKETARFHQFVLTDEMGSHLYGYCLKTWVRAPDNDIQRIKKLVSYYIVANSLVGEHIDPLNQLFLPQCIILMSSHPFHNTYIRMLQELESIDSKSEILQALGLLFTKLNVIIPQPGSRPLIIFWKSIKVSFSFPASSSPPMSDVNHRILFRSVEPATIILLINVLLCESSILITSSKLDDLGAICEALLDLLHPFQWPFLYIPVLPSSRKHILNAPLPFLIGMHSCIDPFIDQYPTVWVLHLDSGILERPRVETAFTCIPWQLAWRLYRSIRQHMNLYQRYHPTKSSSLPEQLPSNAVDEQYSHETVSQMNHEALFGVRCVVTYCTVDAVYSYSDQIEDCAFEPNTEYDSWVDSTPLHVQVELKDKKARKFFQFKRKRRKRKSILDAKHIQQQIQSVKVDHKANIAQLRRAFASLYAQLLHAMRPNTVIDLQRVEPHLREFTSILAHSQMMQGLLAHAELIQFPEWFERECALIRESERQSAAKQHKRVRLGCMWKLGSQVRSWKWRYFELGHDNLLSYYQVKDHLVGLIERRFQVQKMEPSERKIRLLESIDRLLIRSKQSCHKGSLQLTHGETEVSIPQTKESIFKTPYSFQVITSSRVLVLSAGSEYDREEWMRSIRLKTLLH